MQHMTWLKGRQCTGLLCFQQIAGTHSTTSHSSFTLVRPSPPFNEIRSRLDLGTNAERAQNEYLCKQVDVADQLFEEILAHAKDAWETIEVFMQRNQISICLGRYDVRCSPT
jgi:hypothetical protein